MIRSLARRAARALDEYAKSRWPDAEPVKTTAPTEFSARQLPAMTMAELRGSVLALTRRIADATNATVAVCGAAREVLSSAERLVSAPATQGPLDASEAPPTCVEGLRRLEHSTIAVEHHAEQLALVLSLLSVDPDDPAS